MALELGAAVVAGAASPAQCDGKVAGDADGCEEEGGKFVAMESEMIIKM